jgi:hypothetical protein
MRIVGARIVLRDEPKETDNEDYFRWRNLEEWEYYRVAQPQEGSL